MVMPYLYIGRYAYRLQIRASLYRELLPTMSELRGTLSIIAPITIGPMSKRLS